MPWCPVCHAEYRAGVKVCRQCQADLVSTPPRAGERYTPPAENLFDTAAEKLAQSGRLRAWGRQFVDGFRLFGESFRLMLRMRNLWWPMAVLAVINTTGTIRLLPPLGNTPGLLKMINYSSMGEVRRTLQYWWGGVLPAVEHLHDGIEEAPPVVMLPLGSAYNLVGGAVTLAASRESLAWYDPRGLGLSLAYSLGYALIVVALLRRMLASVRQERPARGRLWADTKQSLWPLYAWRVFSVWLLWLPLGFLVSLLGQEGVRQAASAAINLLALSLIYTATIIVVLRPPLRRAPLLSVRVFAAEFLTFLGLLLAYRVCSDAIGLAVSPLRLLFWATWDPQFAARYVMPPLALLVNIAIIAVQLTLATAFVLIVLRATERPRVSPAPPEAASA